MDKIFVHIKKEGGVLTRTLPFCAKFAYCIIENNKRKEDTEMLHNFIVWLLSRAIWAAIVAIILVIKIIVAILFFIMWIL